MDKLNKLWKRERFIDEIRKSGQLILDAIEGKEK